MTYSAHSEHHSGDRWAAAQTRGNVLLILEDFDQLRARFARHFAQNGYDIYSSSTIAGALMIAREERPQAILVDYELRGAAIAGAITKLREALPESYIVLIGAPETGALEVMAKSAGATEVIERSGSIGLVDDLMRAT